MFTESKVEREEKSKRERLSVGIIFVLFGSASYGMLSTFVKLAYKSGYTTAEVTFAQFAWGLACLLGLGFLSKNDRDPVSRRDATALMSAGLSVGATSCLYYVCVRYINASVAVVLLMQSVWIGVVVEAFQRRRWPEIPKIFAVLLTLFGTVLATDILNSSVSSISVTGLVFGFLAAISFSTTLFASNSVATHLSALKRSLYMLIGGALVVAVFGLITQIGPHYLNLKFVPQEFISDQPFRFEILLSYGFVVALFGTVIPPLLLNRGFPITGVGLGSILSAVELPFAILISFLFLSETIHLTQWVGVLIILSAIVLMNFRLLIKGA